MSLSRAVLSTGEPTGFGPGPVPAFDLVPLVDDPFTLPCDDAWLRESGSRAHAYLEAAKRGWTEHPEWMDFLDRESPVAPLKQAERDLYLHHWPGLLAAKKVLDLGCGIGRFTMPLLDRGATVIGVDGDLESLRRCAWHAAGRPGRLDLHWSSVHKLPDDDDYDAIIAAEVLCYVPDFEGVLEGLVARLRPGGRLALSWEAPYGWAASEDAPQASLHQALSGEGIVDLPGDRWVRTVERSTLHALLEGVGLEVEHITPTHYTVDGPLEPCLDDEIDLQTLLDWESRCREHPVWRPLNRIWTAAARRR